MANTVEGDSASDGQLVAVVVPPKKLPGFSTAKSPSQILAINYRAFGA
jgi:hypothetical protein